MPSTSSLPTGAVTFLFTDIEGSTPLFQRYPDAMPQALARHHEILQAAVAANHGEVFQVVGDAFCAAFPDPGDALEAALAAQYGLQAEPWGATGPLRVRMGLHTGPAEIRNGEYQSGITLIRVQRFMAAGHGGQVLLSPTTAGLVKDQLPEGAALRDLGAYRLRGLGQGEHIFQLVAPDLSVDFPPLRAAESVDDGGRADVALKQLVSGRLAGREAELEKLLEHWQLSGQAHGHLVTLSGEPGIGKTRLAQELIDRVRVGGGVVLRGGSYEYEAATPYLPFVEALQDWVHIQSPLALKEALGDTAPEIAKLAPEVESKIGPLVESPPLPTAEERLRLFDNIARLFQSLALPGGLLFFADDLHWADQGTLSLLHYLLRRLRHDRILFLGAYREVELDRAHPLAAALVEWNRERLVTRLTLSRLDRQETEKMLALILGQAQVPESILEVIFRETEGNPFFVEEVVKSLIEQGEIWLQRGRWESKDVLALPIPQSVKEAIGRRLDRLSPETVEVLTTAAGLGKQFRFDELVAIRFMEEESLLDSLDEADSAQLVSASGVDSYRFTHDKIREVLYEELNPIRQRRLHRKIGQGLEVLYKTNLGAHANSLAYHFTLSGDLEKSLSYALQAAENAEQIFAHQEALTFYQQAWEAARELKQEDQQALIDERMGTIISITGPLDSTLMAFQRALEQTTEPSRKAILLARIGDAYIMAGDERGMPFLQQAQEMLDPETQKLMLATVTANLGRYYHFKAEHSLAIEYLEQALALAMPLEDAYTLGIIYGYLSGTYQHLGRYEEADRWAQACIDLGEQQAYPMAIAWGYEFMSENAFFTGNWAKALHFAALDVEYGNKLGAPGRVAWAGYARAGVLWGQGNLQEGLEVAKSALEMAENLGEERLASWLDPFLAIFHADLGNASEAEAHAKGGLQRAEALGQLVIHAYALHARGYINLRLGDTDQARLWYGQAVERWRGTESRMAALYSLGYYAEALFENNRLEEALATVTEALALTDESHAAHFGAVARRVAGQIFIAQGQLSDADQSIERAVTEFKQLGSHLELGRGLIQRAILRNLMGKRAQAREDARQALAIFRDSGALLDAIRAESLVNYKLSQK